MDEKEIYYLDCWYKNQFTFSNTDHTKRLVFTPYYKSIIGKQITIAEAIQEGCEHICLNGELIKE